jgi:hypothetical protein
MTPLLAAADAPQAAAVLAAALAAAVALAVDRPGLRALAALAAPLLAGAALLSMVGDDVADAVSARPAFALAGGAAGLAGLAAAVVVLRGRPAWVAVLALVALPFRVPVPVGDDTANLLVPLYAVIGAGVLAAVLGWWRTARNAPAATPDAVEDGPRSRNVRRLRVALGAFLVVYAAQALYSTDLDEATKNVCFFYVPFALLFRLLLDVPWSQALLGGRLPRRRRARPGLRGGRIRRVRHRRAADHEREGPRDDRAEGVLPRQLALLRPEHLRALPRAGDDRARRRPPVDPPPPRHAAHRRRARGAVGRHGAVALAVELHRAAARPRRPGGAALASPPGHRPRRRHLRGRRRGRAAGGQLARDRGRLGPRASTARRAGGSTS